MRAVIGILCFIVVVFPNPIESMWLCGKPESEKDEIPELTARHYQSFENEGVNYTLPPGRYNVGIVKQMGKEYIVGYIENGPHGNILCPFIAPRVDLDGRNGKIKIRLDGKCAIVYYPIFVTDPVRDLLFQKYPAEFIREVEIKPDPLPLFQAALTNTVASLQASSSSIKKSKQ